MKDGREFATTLLRAANIETLLIDTGFPPPQEVLPLPELGELGDCGAEPILRLEVLMERLLGENDSFTRAALGVAPTSKLMYSSDGTGVPELHWISALDGRRVLGEALGEMVAHGELSLSRAETVGEDILRTNARRLYGLG